MEHKSQREPLKFDPTENQKSTQTESEGYLYPPACLEAHELWKKYQISKKTETELLVDALKALDLRQIIENQNKQIAHQNNMLNNLNRNFGQFSRETPNAAPHTNKSGPRSNNKSKNGSSKRPKRED